MKSMLNDTGCYLLDVIYLFKLESVDREWDLWETY